MATINIALPSKDMEEPTVRLFKDTRIEIKRGGRNSRVMLAGFDGLESGTFMRSSDVAEFVAGGLYDVGVTTKEVAAEDGSKLVELCNLDFSRNGRQTKVVLFTNPDATGIDSLEKIPKGSRVKTEYPNLTHAFLRDRGLLGRVKLVPSRGSTEAHVPMPYPLGVCLVDSGTTLTAHGHMPLATLMTSDTVLVANPISYRDADQRTLIEDLASLLMGTVNARRMRTMKFNAPKDALDSILGILPKREGQSPTISREADDGMVAVEYVVLVEEINALKPKLKRAGATFILVHREESVMP